MISLVTWIWQGLAIAVMTATLLASARRLDAATRHTIWWLAAAAVLGLPAAYALSATALETNTAPAALPVPPAPDWVLLSLVVAWTAFTTAGLIRVAMSVRVLLRLKRAGEPLDAALVSRLAAHQPPGTGLPEIRVWDGATGASALGLGRPVILVSRSLVDTLADDQLAAIVMHEHAHLVRRDAWWQLLQAIVAAAAGWHPAVWFIGRRISLEREAACDDYVLVRTRAPREYAHALVEAAAARHRWHVAIPGAGGPASALRLRLRRLLDSGLDRRTRPSPGTTLIGVAALAAAVATGTRAPALVVVVDAVASLPGVDSPLNEAARLLPLPRPAPPGSIPKARVTTDALVARAVTPATPMTTPPASSPAIADVPPLVSSGLAPMNTMSLEPAPAGPGGFARDLAPSVPPSTSAWDTISRAATTAGQGVGNAGTAAGNGARDAGMSIGRFFTRTGKEIAGRF